MGAVGSFPGYAPDPYLENLLRGALGAAWGANPATGQVMPGPISHLSERLRGDFARAGMPQLGNVFPVPTYTSGSGAFSGGFAGSATPYIPPLLAGAPFGQIPGGFDWNYQGPPPGQFTVGAPWGFGWFG